MIARRIITASIAVCLTIGATAGLSGCANPIDSIVKGAVEQASGGEVKLGNGGSLPSGWPTQVPVVEGKITSSMALGGKDGGWSVSITASGSVESVLAKAEAQLSGAGFTSSFSGTSGTSGGSIYTNDVYAVVLTVADNSGSTVVNYVVATQ